VSFSSKERIKHFLRRLILIAIMSSVGITAIAYATDYVVFRYRVASNRVPFGQVTVNHFDAVQQKNGKTEFIFDPPQVETCANSLFPRDGYPPCWYLKRHTEPRTNI
jgi:hypothetical protein